MEETKKEKTIYDLKLHETLVVIENIKRPVINANNNTETVDDIKRYEITRVPGGWVYAFEYPGFRQSPIVFVPFNNEFIDLSKPLIKK